MFEIGFLIGIYGYSIFLFGLAGILYAPFVILFTILFLAAPVYYYRKQLRVWLQVSHRAVFGKHDAIVLFFFALLAVQAVVNLVGVFGPELSFDALWYHLTFPKLYLTHHMIVFVPGGLLYYSAMPKFLELLYTGGLAFGSSLFPKLIHFGFGVAILLVLYRLSRKFFSQRLSLLVLIIFYANLVVGWESISAYIDLGRTFFELLSVWAFFEWGEKQEKKWFFYSAIFMGFAITTKLLALGSLAIVLIFLIYLLKKKKEQLSKIFRLLISYSSVALFVPFPWFVFSLINTGSPVYPFFTHTYPVSFPWQLFNPFYFVMSIWNLFLYSADPLNPLYLMVLPLGIVTFRLWYRKLRYILFFAAGGLLLWYITPQTGGGRFILPYLPYFSLLTVASIDSLTKQQWKKYLFAAAIVLAVISIGYRSIANAKFLPVIFGRESPSQFLASHLNFSFGDFYDIDGYFASHIKPTDKVLLYGFHNLYYVDFPFIDSSWIQKGDMFTYVAVQNGALPKRFAQWQLIYRNPQTHVSLYWAGGIPWTY